MPGPAAVHDLPPLSWLGVKCGQVSNIRTSWSHRLPEFEYAYQDAEAHQFTGRHSLKVTAETHWYNTDDPANFPGKAQDFLRLCMSGTSGDLRHPLIGKFNAFVADGEFEITAQSSAGVSVRVTWTESRKGDEGTARIDTSKADMTANAEQLDEAIAVLGIDYPDGMVNTTFAGMVADVLSIGTSLVNDVKWQVNKTIGMVDSIYEQMQIAANAVMFVDAATKDSVAGAPFRWVFETACDALRYSLVAHLADVLEGGQETKNYTTKTDATLASLSLELDADIAGLIQLNPSLVAKPVVPKGTTVAYFA